MSFSGGVNLGTAYGRVTLDASGVHAAMDGVRNSVSGGLQSFGGNLQGLGAAIRNIGANLTLLTAPIMAFGVQGIRTFRDFDDAMREIQARTRLTDDAMEELRQTAIQVGEDTVFGATDAANAMLQLLSSGMSVEETLATLPSVMDLAAASGEDLGNTADWITDIMAAYGLEAEHAAEVSDALVRASGSGSASVGDLALGFQNAGGVAASFGMSVDETAAILQIFSENGIKGAEAGTQLRSMLNHMTSDTEDVTGMWEDLGVELFDSEGQFRGMSTVIGDLRTSMADMTEEERIQAVRTLGGAYGQMGLNALIAGGDIDEMLASMEEAASASEVAQARMSGFSGDIEEASGAVETLALTVLPELVENGLRPIIQEITRIVRAVTAWARENPELAATVTRVAAALVVLGPALVAVGTVINIVGGAIAGLGTLFAIATGPVGLVIAGIAAIVAAFNTDFMGIRTTVQNVVDFVRPHLVELWRNLTGGGLSGPLEQGEQMFAAPLADRLRTSLQLVIITLQEMGGEIGEEINSLRNRVTVALNNLFGGGGGVSGPVEQGDTGFVTLGQRLSNALREALNGIVVDLSTLRDNIADSIHTAVQNAIVQFVVNHPQTVLRLLRWRFELGNLGETLRTRISGVVNGLQNLDFSGLTSTISSGVHGAVQAIEGLDFSGLGTTISEGVQGAVQALNNLDLSVDAEKALRDVLSALVSAAGIVFGGPIGTVLGIGRLVATAIADDFLGIGTFLQESGIQQTVETAVSGLFDLIRGAFSGGGGGSGGISGPLEQGEVMFAGVGERLSDQLAEWGQAFVDWIGPAVTDLAERLPEIINSIVTWIGEQIPILVTNLLNFATEFVNWIGPAIIDVIPRLGDFLATVLNWITSTAIPDLITRGLEIATSFIGWVAQAATDVLPALVTFMTTVGNWILNDLIPSVVEAALDVGEALVTGIRDGIENLWGGIKEWFENDVREFLQGLQGTVLGALLGIHEIDLTDTQLEIFSQYVQPTQNDGTVTPTPFGGSALGGMIPGNLPRLVGEMGPELFVPSGSGMVVSNDQLMTALGALGGGGGHGDIYVTVPADALATYPQAVENGRAFGEALRERLNGMG